MDTRSVTGTGLHDLKASRSTEQVPLLPLQELCAWQSLPCLLLFERDADVPSKYGIYPVVDGVVFHEGYLR